MKNLTLFLSTGVLALTPTIASAQFVTRPSINRPSINTPSVGVANPSINISRPNINSPTFNNPSVGTVNSNFVNNSISSPQINLPIVVPSVPGNFVDNNTPISGVNQFNLIRNVVNVGLPNTEFVGSPEISPFFSLVDFSSVSPALPTEADFVSRNTIPSDPPFDPSDPNADRTDDAFFINLQTGFFPNPRLPFPTVRIAIPSLPNLDQFVNRLEFVTTNFGTFKADDTFSPIPTNTAGTQTQFFRLVDDNGTPSLFNFADDAARSAASGITLSVVGNNTNIDNQFTSFNNFPTGNLSLTGTLPTPSNPTSITINITGLD